MGRTQLNLRMSEDEKEEWREYSEQARWPDNLTDFVKQAVREKIDRMDGEDGAEAATVDASGVRDDEILERIQSLRNDLQALEGEVGDAVDAVHAQSGVDPDLAPEVFDALSEGESNAKTEQEITDDVHAAKDDWEWNMGAVRFALENLRKNTNTVVKIPGGGRHSEQTRWYLAEGA